MLKKFKCHLAIVVMIAGMVNSTFVRPVMAQQNKVLFPCFNHVIFSRQGIVR
ncbi:MAG: hypothetical protein HUU09_03930 [Candidatus Jettenia caeni]|uniref:hypothetical protein n=1 Tax=Candidatus Jettenia sp. AMX1 TaxID=2293637 RepID=UPI0003261F49|nr:hypothetical protein [Candidatus Jettenia sp. AMX1]NUN22600.1 hypothetical protein [Candidatus Jettenia caeni]WKZ14104.1 MAG: hypothetical protein QY317_09300 [Candidatus Jettenia caeni]